MFTLLDVLTSSLSIFFISIDVVYHTERKWLHKLIAWRFKSFHKGQFFLPSLEGVSVLICNGFPDGNNGCFQLQPKGFLVPHVFLGFSGF